MSWFFAPLIPFSYEAIMIDPPWRFMNRSERGEAKNPVAHYECMTLDQIKALPVGHLAQRDCWLWLWATHPMQDVAFEVMRA